MTTLPVWEAWTSKEVNGVSKGAWNLIQLERYLKVRPKHKVKKILGWLSTIKKEKIGLKCTKSMRLTALTLTQRNSQKLQRKSTSKGFLFQMRDFFKLHEWTPLLPPKFGEKNEKKTLSEDEPHSSHPPSSTRFPNSNQSKTRARASATC